MINEVVFDNLTYALLEVRVNFIANMLAGECRMYIFFSHVLEEKQDRSRLHVPSSVC